MLINVSFQKTAEDKNLGKVLEKTIFYIYPSQPRVKLNINLPRLRYEQYVILLMSKHLHLFSRSLALYQPTHTSPFALAAGKVQLALPPESSFALELTVKHALLCCHRRAEHKGTGPDPRAVVSRAPAVSGREREAPTSSLKILRKLSVLTHFSLCTAAHICKSQRLKKNGAPDQPQFILPFCFSLLSFIRFLLPLLC